MALEPGTRLGSFEILGPLGKGGMGEVYKARDARLGRDVAIKVLPEAFARDPARAARFEREARLLAAVNHPAIAAIYGAEEFDSVPCIVMELVPGETLSEKMAHGALSMEEALGLGRQIAEALEAAHEKGVVHRDLKPSNIKVTPEGRVKVLDLGLAKVMETPAPADLSSFPTQVDEETRPGMILGTLEFMSPEQARGKPVDKRTDIWAFGCVLFEMLSGHRPFGGETPSDVIAAVLSREPDWAVLPRATPTRVRELLSRCLEKDTGQRMRDIGDARIEIQQVLGERPSGAPSETPPARRLGRPHFIAVAAALVAVAIAAGWLALRRRTQSDLLPERITLAVLPFRDLSAQPNGQLLGDGFAATLRVRLARLPGIQVVPGSALTDAPQKEADLYRAAASLGANIVVTGSLQRANEQMRIIFGISTTALHRQLAADEVTGQASELFLMQDQVAEKVAGSLRLPSQALRSQAPSGLETAVQQERYVQALGSLQRYDRPASVEGAIGVLQALAAERPNSALVHAALGRAYLFKFNLTRERIWAEQARTSSARAQQLDSGLPEVDVTLGELNLRTGQPRAAIGAFQRALSIRPNDYEAVLGLARAYDGSGAVSDAETTYRRAIQLQPSYWSGYSKFAAFYFTRGKYAQAAEMFRRVTELAPDNAKGFSNLCAAYHQMDRFEEALAACQKSLTIEPSSGAYSNAGSSEFFLGRYAEASRDFEKAVALTPQRYDGWADLGDSHYWGGQEAKARDAYTRAIRLARAELEINARIPSAHARLAVCLARTGDHAGAREHIGRALALTRTDPQVLYNAAIVASLARKREEAIGWIGLAVEAGFGAQHIRNEPQFADFRDDRKFQQALQRKTLNNP